MKANSVYGLFIFLCLFWSDSFSQKKKAANPGQQSKSLQSGRNILDDYVANENWKPGKQFDSDSFNIVRRGISRVLDEQAIRNAYNSYTQKLSADFKKLDEHLSSTKSAYLFFRSRDYRDTIAFQTITVDDLHGGRLVRVSFSKTVSAACQTVYVSLDTTKYKAFNRYKGKRKIMVRVLELLTPCSQVDRFPKIQITEAYSNYLRELIAQILRDYPKFRTSMSAYDAMEAKNNLAALDYRIYYRINFIKHCYERM